MNPQHERRRALGLMRLRKGGDSTSQSSSDTMNQDQRVAVQDGIGLSGSSGNVINMNSSDAVKAIAQLGTDAIAKSGEAIVQLNQSSQAANAAAWDATLTKGAALVDKLIDSSTSLGTAAIDKFQPAENKAQDTSLKLGMIAAAVVAANILLTNMGGKKA